MIANFVTTDELQLLHTKLDKLLACFDGAKNNTFEEKIYSNKELCKRLSLCSKTLQNYRDNGLIEFKQIGRKIYYSENAVQSFLANHSCKIFK